jgi:hypothetical protein
MAQAIIRIDEEDDGGIEVIVPAWENAVITSISSYSMTQFPAFKDNPDEEPDYEDLTRQVAEQLCEQLKIPAYSIWQEILPAVRQAVSPGPGGESPRYFRV